MPCTIFFPSKREPFVLIPFALKAGQHPDSFRNFWQRIPDDHPAIARDIQWHPGTFDIVES